MNNYVFININVSRAKLLSVNNYKQYNFLYCNNIFLFCYIDNRIQLNRNKTLKLNKSETKIIIINC